jgi:tetratricopeptide (TPR) repeat protein
MSTMQLASSAPLLARSLACASALAALALAARPAAEGFAQDPAAEADLELVRSADRALRRGGPGETLRDLEELLADEPAMAAAREVLARCREQAGDLELALAEARRALADAGAPPEGDSSGERAVHGRCARTLARLLLVRGEGAEAFGVLDEARPALAPGTDARDAWALGSALAAAGRREEARDAWRTGMEGERGEDWERLLARARCERALGFLERASRSLVEADDLAERGEGREADVLVELGAVYFEADGEIEHREARARSPAVLFDKALDIHPGHEGALLGLFRLHRFNWNRQRRSPGEILGELLARRPRSIEGLLAGAAADLDDGQLRSARERLNLLGELCPKRRELRTLEAAMAWIEHRRDDARAALGELAREDPADARPERELGRHLCELYRFAEALPFLRQAVERDPADAEAWTELGRALANTGDEESAREALAKAVERAEGRQNAWRHNTLLVLERMRSGLVNESAGELSFAWAPDAASVLRAYLVPFYRSARAELSERYGYTPGPVHVEVFHRHADFSVRSTGFEGFPALGVCFGPVVTAVSPLAELRGRFSWARTSFHEFTHVIHLGLSHNRCPRWITEGLATWEEENKNRAWSRNMRRELVDALANGDLIPVRELNRAFRGPRILFGYYQGGLLCRMLIEEGGFPPMIRLLEAFDRGLDLDQALAEVVASTPEELDRRFERYARELISELVIEPRWSPATAARLRLELPREAPEGEAARRAWAERWCDVAWAWWQAGRRVDAEEALRRVERAGDLPPRALFLRGEIALAASDKDRARELFERGFEAGGEDFRARMALGTLAMQAGDWDGAEEAFLAAEKVFPGYEEAELSAELSLARVYAHAGRTDDVQRARERWLAYNADEYPLRIEVARWHAKAGRDRESARWYGEANEIDPFRRALHVEWAEVLARAGEHEDALRELEVAAIVPPELDLDKPEALTKEERAGLLARQAEELVALGRVEEGQGRARKALELDAGCEAARGVLERVQ